MKPSEPIGATTVRLGFATADQVQKALEEQRARIARGDKNVLIGVLMEQMGIITTGQLLKVLNHYHQTGRVPISEDAVRLAARLRANTTDEQRVITFTGAEVDDGAPTVAAQVAEALALMGQGEVLLVDANLRAPVLHGLFSLNQQPGLTDLLSGGTDIDDAVVATGVPSLSLLPAGNIVVDFMSLLLSDECVQALGALAGRFRYVIVAAAPVLKYPEGTLMAAQSQGAVMVLRAGERRTGQAVEIQRILDGVRVSVLGAVLTAPGVEQSKGGGLTGWWRRRRAERGLSAR